MNKDLNVRFRKHWSVGRPTNLRCDRPHRSVFANVSEEHWPSPCFTPFVNLRPFFRGLKPFGGPAPYYANAPPSIIYYGNMMLDVRTSYLPPRFQDLQLRREARVWCSAWTLRVDFPERLRFVFRLWWRNTAVICAKEMRRYSSWRRRSVTTRNRWLSCTRRLFLVDSRICSASTASSCIPLRRGCICVALRPLRVLRSADGWIWGSGGTVINREGWSMWSLMNLT